MGFLRLSPMSHLPAIKRLHVEWPHLHKNNEMCASNAGNFMHERVDAVAE